MLPQMKPRPLCTPRPLQRYCVPRSAAIRAAYMRPLQSTFDGAPVWHFYAACTFGDARREGYIGGRKGAPPVAESSDRSGWAATCICANNVRHKCLVATRRAAFLAGARNSAPPLCAVFLSISFWASKKKWPPEGDKPKDIAKGIRSFPPAESGNAAFSVSACISCKLTMPMAEICHIVPLRGQGLFARPKRP